jgi:hypothetical protein
MASASAAQCHEADADRRATAGRLGETTRARLSLKYREQIVARSGPFRRGGITTTTAKIDARIAFARLYHESMQAGRDRAGHRRCIPTGDISGREMMRCKTA